MSDAFADDIRLHFISYFYQVSYPAFVWDNNWHFVVGTYDGLNLKLYVDGVLVATQSAPGINIRYNLPDNNFYIGNYPNCHSVPGESQFPGSVDEVEVFSRALVPREIQGIFNAQGVGKCRPLP